MLTVLHALGPRSSRQASTTPSQEPLGEEGKSPITRFHKVAARCSGFFAVAFFGSSESLKKTAPRRYSAARGFPETFCMRTDMLELGTCQF